MRHCLVVSLVILYNPLEALLCPPNSCFWHTIVSYQWAPSPCVQLALTLAPTSGATATAADTDNVSTGATVAVAAAALQAPPARSADEESKWKAVRAFLRMVFDLISRHKQKLWALVPWDPTALYFLFQKHQATYQQLQVGILMGCGRRGAIMPYA